mgnify:CR=1 FL=1
MGVSASVAAAANVIVGVCRSLQHWRGGWTAPDIHQPGSSMAQALSSPLSCEGDLLPPCQQQQQQQLGIAHTCTMFWVQRSSHTCLRVGVCGWVGWLVGVSACVHMCQQQRVLLSACVGPCSAGGAGWGAPDIQQPGFEAQAFAGPLSHKATCCHHAGS